MRQGMVLGKTSRDPDGEGAAPLESALFVTLNVTAFKQK